MMKLFDNGDEIKGKKDPVDVALVAMKEKDRKQRDVNGKTIMISFLKVLTVP